MAKLNNKIDNNVFTIDVDCAKFDVEVEIKDFEFNGFKRNFECNTVIGQFTLSDINILPRTKFEKFLSKISKPLLFRKIRRDIKKSINRKKVNRYNKNITEINSQYENDIDNETK